MLHINQVKGLNELRDLLTHEEKASNTLLDVCEKFFTSKMTRQLNTLKRKGYFASEVLLILLYLPFLGVVPPMREGLFKSGCAKLTDAQKDVYYRLKNNSNIDWRHLLFMFAKRFRKTTTEKGEEAENTVKCLIVDDTDCSKTGKKIEFIGKIFDHVRYRWVLGFKLLTLGYWDGKSFLPLDFSLHNEKGKNKKRPFGLTLTELKKRFKKQRPKNSSGAKRAKELSINKITNAIKMVKRAVKNGFVVDYVLADSWFISEFFINSIREIKNGLLHVLGICKMDKRKYTLEGEKFTAKELLQKFKGRKKRSRKVNAWYVELTVDYKGIPVKLFFSRYSKRSKWHLLLTTDLSLTFNKAIEIYNIRWSIEVFFKEAKQYLKLGKSQANDFDAQIADVTISMMQYIILTLHKRFQAYETLGELFRQNQKYFLELTLAERLWGLFIELQRQILELFELDIEEVIEKMLSQPRYEAAMLKILLVLANRNTNITKIE
jgi:hypothetical protein